jgi:4-phytase/acid phosphatase
VFAWAAPAVPPASDATGTDLVYVFILSRHGIRSSISNNESLGKYAAAPWPDWEVPPGILTPHGRNQMVLMGSYYHADYVRQGLLTGQPATDAGRIFYRSDNDQRTIVSDQALGEGLTPGIPVRVHFIHPGIKDPLFSPSWLHIGHPDQALAQAAVLGRIAGQPELLLAEHRTSLDALERILLAGNVTPADNSPSLELLTNMEQTLGTVHMAEKLAEAVLLQYADGNPLSAVGWGRLRPSDIMPLTDLVSLGFYQYRALFVAQISASNLAAHLLASLAQAASGQRVAGALGRPGDRMAVLGGHDGNIVALATVLGGHWLVPGTVADLPLPGGALIFELRRNHRDGRLVVRTKYVVQTYEQMRANSALTLEHPPAISPMFIPDCSSAGPGYDAPLDRFTAHVQAALEPRFTAPEPGEVQ